MHLQVKRTALSRAVLALGAGCARRLGLAAFPRDGLLACRRAVSHQACPLLFGPTQLSDQPRDLGALGRDGLLLQVCVAASGQAFRRMRRSQSRL